MLAINRRHMIRWHVAGGEVENGHAERPMGLGLAGGRGLSNVTPSLRLASDERNHPPMNADGTIEQLSIEQAIIRRADVTGEREVQQRLATADNTGFASPMAF